MRGTAERERRRARELRGRAAGLRQASELLGERVVATGLASPRALGGRGETFSLRLWKHGQTVRLVRHHLRRWLESRGVGSDVATEIVLACSEVCANAIEHPASSAHQAFEVEARCDNGELTLSVQDFGEWRDVDASAWRGRGLAMVRTLMDAVDVRPSAGGTRVVMRRRV
jgi:anti-sigma regulatory factor (Ser/Thr protein kinase)